MEGQHRALVFTRPRTENATGLGHSARSDGEPTESVRSAALERDTLWGEGRGKTFGYGGLRTVQTTACGASVSLRYGQTNMVRAIGMGSGARKGVLRLCARLPAEKRTVFFMQGGTAHAAGPRIRGSKCATLSPSALQFRSPPFATNQRRRNMARDDGQMDHDDRVIRRLGPL